MLSVDGFHVSAIEVGFTADATTADRGRRRDGVRARQRQRRHRRPRGHVAGGVERLDADAVGAGAVEPGVRERRGGRRRLLDAAAVEVVPRHADVVRRGRPGHCRPSSCRPSRPRRPSAVTASPMSGAQAAVAAVSVVRADTFPAASKACTPSTWLVPQSETRERERTRGRRAGAHAVQEERVAGDADVVRRGRPREADRRRGTGGGEARRRRRRGHVGARRRGGGDRRAGGGVARRVERLDAEHVARAAAEACEREARRGRRAGGDAVTEEPVARDADVVRRCRPGDRRRGCGDGAGREPARRGRRRRRRGRPWSTP